MNKMCREGVVTEPLTHRVSDSLQSRRKVPGATQGCVGREDYKLHCCVYYLKTKLSFMTVYMSRQVYSSAVYKENVCVVETHPQKCYTARAAKSQRIGWFNMWRGSEVVASFCVISMCLSLHGPPAPQGC